MPEIADLRLYESGDSADKDRIERPQDLLALEDDEDFDESLLERLWGLTEMFPESVRTATQSLTDLSMKSASWFWEYGRKGLWVVASSATILVLPVMFETERVQMEEQHLQQQRQLLLGPNAAVSGSQGGMMPGMPPLPQVSPPK